MAGLRERKKEQLRWTLARVALRLFEERGFEETTIEAIAEAANVSPRTFFRYFRSKEDVILIDPDGRLASIHGAARAFRADEPVLAVLESAWAEAADRYFSDVELTVATYRLSRAEPVLAARLLSFQTEWSHAVARAVAERLGVDPATDLRPEILVSSAQAILRSAMNRWAEAGCPGHPHDVVHAGFAMLGPTFEAVLQQVRTPATGAR